MIKSTQLGVAEPIASDRPQFTHCLFFVGQLAVQCARHEASDDNMRRRCRQRAAHSFVVHSVRFNFAYPSFGPSRIHSSEQET